MERDTNKKCYERTVQRKHEERAQAFYVQQLNSVLFVYFFNYYTSFN